MSNTDPYAGFEPPPSDFPQMAQKLEPNQWLQGTVIAVRAFPTDKGDKPVLDLQMIGASSPLDNIPGQTRSFVCGSMALHSLVLANKPPIGSTVTITCTGYKEQAKTWNLEVAGDAPTAAVPPPVAAVPAPAPAPAAVEYE